MNKTANSNVKTDKKPSREPLLKFDLREVLSVTDIYSIIILTAYTLLAIIFFPKIENAANWILINIFIIASIVTIAAADVKLNAGRLFRLFRRVCLAPLVYFIYSQAHVYIHAVNPHDYDLLLITWDKFFFGLNPTQWLNSISFPVLTEYLQFSYITYFFMPLLHGIELHLKNRDNDFNEFSRKVILAFYLSYILYFILPAIGPRFTLHDFSQINLELPGIWLTIFFRDFVNSGGGIPLGTLTPEVFVNRDCMPSGHTWITVVNIYLAFRYRSHFRWVFFVLGTSLIVATIYLRYHYVVDVIAGILLAILTLRFEPHIRKILEKSGFN